MKTFLTIVGLALLMMLALFVSGWLIIKAKLRKFVADLAEMEGLPGLVPPFRIRLEPDNGREWQCEASVRGAGDELMTLGFVRIGTFCSDPASVRFEAWHHPDEKIYATVYQGYALRAPGQVSLEGPAGDRTEAAERAADQPVVWIDLLSSYPDGRTFTCSSGHDNLLGHPGNFIPAYLPGLSPAELFEEFRRLRPSSSPEPTSAAGFPDRYVGDWHRLMDWHISTGGPTREALQHSLRRFDDIPDGLLDMMCYQWQARIEDFLDHELRDEWLRQESCSAAEWEQMRDRLVLVHDQIGVERLTELLASVEEVDTDSSDVLDSAWDEWYRQAGEMLENHSPREAFAILNEQFPQRFRFEKRGELHTPVAADAWLMPSHSE